MSRPPEGIRFSDRVALIPPMPYTLRGVFMPHTHGTNYQPYRTCKVGAWVLSGEELLEFQSLSLGFLGLKGKVGAAIKSPAAGLLIYPSWNTEAGNNGDSHAYAEGDGSTPADDLHYAFALVLPLGGDVPLTAETVYGSLCDMLARHRGDLFHHKDLVSRYGKKPDHEIDSLLSNMRRRNIVVKRAVDIADRTLQNQLREIRSTHAAHF